MVVLLLLTATTVLTVSLTLFYKWKMKQIAATKTEPPTPNTVPAPNTAPDLNTLPAPSTVLSPNEPVHIYETIDDHIEQPLSLQPPQLHHTLQIKRPSQEMDINPAVYEEPRQNIKLMCNVSYNTSTNAEVEWNTKPNYPFSGGEESATGDEGANMATLGNIAERNH